MQFRVMGKRIQCLRAVYNPEKKMGEQKLIVSVHADMETLPENLGELSVLRPDELEQFKQWLKQYRERLKQEKAKSLIDASAQTVSELTEAVKNHCELIDEQTALSLTLAVEKLTGVLEQRGYLQKENKADNNKSLFSKFKAEILALKAQGKTIRQILAVLQAKDPKRADYLTYNGLRSYIRRNC